MQRTKTAKAPSFESRSSLIPSYLDEDPDIDLILPDPVEVVAEDGPVQLGNREFTATPP